MDNHLGSEWPAVNAGLPAEAAAQPSEGASGEGLQVLEGEVARHDGDRNMEVAGHLT